MEKYALKVVIRRPSGQVEELVVDADRAVVGSGAHCEVRLAVEEAEVELLVLAVDANGVTGRLRSETATARLSGERFREGKIPEGAVLQIGKIELSVSAIGGAFTSLGTSKRKRESGSPLVYALGAVGFPLGFYLLLAPLPEQHELPVSLEAPPLFAGPTREQCPQAAVGSSAMLGQKALLEGESSRERAPFSPEDGIAAVSSFERAAACFDVAGETSRSEDARRSSVALKDKLADEFHVHQVRLERALATQKYEDARTEVQILLSFVGRRDSEYTRMLANLQRQIELKFSGKKG